MSDSTQAGPFWRTFYKHWESWLVSIVFLILGYYVNEFASHKAMSIELASEISFDTADYKGPGLKIVYGETPIAKLSKIVVRVRNDGRVPINAADFERDIEITFPNVQVLYVEIESRTPENLAPSVKQGKGEKDAGKIVIEKILLNSGDSFDLAVVLIGNVTSVPKVNARVSGVPTIQVQDKRLGRNTRNSKIAVR